MRSMLIISLLLICLCSGCNTRLGWPGTEQGAGVVGFLAVCALILFGIVTVAVGGDSPSENGRRSGFICGAAMWLVAGLVLQALPHTEGGIQIVPLLPWQYGWIAMIVSSVCWLGILLGCICGMGGDEHGVKDTAKVMAVVIGLNALLSSAAPASAVAVQQPSQIKSSEDPIAQWEKLKSDRQNALDKLMADKEALIVRIKSLGATNKKELMTNPVGRTLVEELEELLRQIANTKNEVGVIETATERAKSRLRTIERETLLTSGKLTAEEYERMSAANHTLEDERRQAQERRALRFGVTNY